MSNKKRLVIGIPGWKVGENSFGCGIHHLEYIRGFGIPRILFPEEAEPQVDVLYLPGGADLNPSVYGRIPSLYTSNTDVNKQFFYDNRLDYFIKSGIPIFGACLGFQMICAKFSSILAQHLYDHPDSTGRGEAGHKVIVVNGAHTGQIFEVNSHHHQGVFSSYLGGPLEALAVYKESKSDPDPLVEAVRHKSLPIYGVQWHPEEFFTSYADELFQLACDHAHKRINEK